MNTTTTTTKKTAVEDIRCGDCGQVVGRVWLENLTWHAVDTAGRPVGWARGYIAQEQARGEVRVAHGRRNVHGACARTAR